MKQFDFIKMKQAWEVKKNNFKKDIEEWRKKDKEDKFLNKDAKEMIKMLEEIIVMGDKLFGTEEEDYEAIGQRMNEIVEEVKTKMAKLEKEKLLNKDEKTKKVKTKEKKL